MIKEKEINQVACVEDLISLIGERVDQLISLDVASRNVVHMLYRFARNKAQAPLAMSAARLLKDKVAPSDYVFIATGWPDRPHVTPEIAETDGPPGTAALARSLYMGLKAVPIILIEEHLVSAMEKVVEAIGLRVVSPEEALLAQQYHAPIHAASVIGFPSEFDRAEEKAVSLLKDYQPSAVVVIEKGGINEKREIHTSRGTATTKWMAKIDVLVEEAARNGIPTIGIGDGGNEIGMGNIQEQIRQHIPFGRQCHCGCGGGISPVNTVDVLVSAAISNWGAYGVAACLSVLCDDIDIFHDAEIEERVLKRCADARFIDGITGLVDPSADGLRWPVHAAFVTLLRETVKQGISSINKMSQS